MLIGKEYLVFLAEVLSKFPSTCQEAQTLCNSRFKVSDAPFWTLLATTLMCTPQHRDTHTIK